MATQLQIRRGTSTQVAAFTGAEGEIVVNTTNDSVHVNDGSTAGGFEMARADLNNVSDTSLNAALTGNTVSALTITTLTLGSTAITATGTELNLLDGVTATTAELNYVDGVTSAIQTQIDTKAPLASPTFTGTATMGGLEIATSASDIGVDLKLDGNKTSNGAIGSIIFENNGDSVGMIRSNRASANDAADMLFYTQATGGANTQRMAITKDGNVLVGKTSANFNSSGRGNVEIGGTGSAILALTAGSSSAYIYNSGSELDILAPTGHAMRFFTNGSNERMRIDSSGNLLVGKTSTSTSVVGSAIYNYGTIGATRDGSHALDLGRNSSDGAIAVFRKDGTSVGSVACRSSGGNLQIHTNQSGIDFGGDGYLPMRGSTITDNSLDIGSSSFRFKDLYLSRSVILGSGYNVSWGGDYSAGNPTIAASSNLIAFYPEGSTSGEAMRIDSSGNLNVGFTSFSSMGSSNTGGRLSADGTTNALARGSNGVVLYLYSGSGGAGNITVTGNTASYNESSDQRLKENIVEAPSSSDDIDAIQVRSFDWKADGRHQKYGMVAQELNMVAPDAVTIPEDPDEMAGVDYSKLVPMLVKEIQSLRARVAQLENN